MKILGIVELAAESPRPMSSCALTEALQGAWRLYSGGVLRGAYATSSPTRVACELEAIDPIHPEVALSRLPLVADGTFRVSYIELSPFVNWEKLYAARDSGS